MVALRKDGAHLDRKGLDLRWHQECKLCGRIHSEYLKVKS